MNSYQGIVKLSNTNKGNDVRVDLGFRREMSAELHAMVRTLF